MHQKNYGTGSLFNTSKLYILKLEEAFRVDKSLEAVSKLNFRYDRLQFTLASLSAQNSSST